MGSCQEGNVEEMIPLIATVLALIISLLYFIVSLKTLKFCLKHFDVNFSSLDLNVRTSSFNDELLIARHISCIIVTGINSVLLSAMWPYFWACYGIDRLCDFKVGSANLER